MLHASRIIACLATRDLNTARTFYETRLGLPLIGTEQNALVFDVKHTLLRISVVENMSPVSHTVLGWEVADIHRAIEGLTERGVKFELFPGIPQDASGVAAFPDGTQVAWFKDPDGNTLSLTQF
jgi:catechol 2,3-dioxygenase-like lactoylglutathione lyase family enzyme